MIRGYVGKNIEPRKMKKNLYSSFFLSFFLFFSTHARDGEISIRNFVISE